MNLDTVARLGFVAALAFLAFIGGALLVLFDVPPAGVLRDSVTAGKALKQQQETAQNVYTTDLWKRARNDERGVTINRPDRTAGGYVLVTSGDGAYAQLLDRDGRVAHEWRRPFSDIWTEDAAVTEPRPDRFIYMRKAQVLANGDLLALYISANDTPWGYGLARLDRNGNVKWRYLAQAHHDFDIAEDGRIAVLTHAISKQPVPTLWFLLDAYVEDHLAILSPEGEEIQQFSLLRLLADSPYAENLHSTVPHYGLGDPLHSNAVEILSAEEAANLGIGAAGHLLVHFRNINFMAVIDPETKQIVWGTRGPWLAAHDPTVLDNGDILLFDNLADYKPGDHSRVLAFDPQTMAIDWTYDGDAEHPLYSHIRSTVQRLGNGNTLITESDGGRVLEITPDGVIAWEYVNPVRAGDADEYIPVLSGAQHVDPADLDADFRSQLESAGQ